MLILSKWIKIINKSIRSSNIMLFFRDRRDAGRQLCRLLEKYKGKDIVVYALPRGGIIPGEEIANYFSVPLDLILAHKLGHPYQPEYAVAALSESGHIVGNSYELDSLGKAWLDREKERQMEEIRKKRKMYFRGQKEIPLQGKIAIIVDDGIATGLTLQVGIMELKDRHPQKIVAAVPVAPKTIANLLKTIVDDFVAIEIPEDCRFLGSVGAYYEEFDQVEDEEVIAILNKHNRV